MALRAGPIGLPQEGGGHNVGWLGLWPKRKQRFKARPDFGESAAGGWQLAVGVVRPPGGVGRR